MPADPRSLADELVSHAGFLRALARGMLRDEHAAEDAVQQAFLRALARPPEARGFLRAWLARVVRQRVLNRVREDEHRAARERAVARPERDDSAGRAELELALQREVAAALAELDEPYRTTLHLRYFRGLTPAAIARELGVPPKTVETRLTRAHARLRTRLARAWNEQDERLRAMWLAALPVGKGLGGLLMAKTLAWVAVGAAVVVGVVWTRRALDGEERDTEAVAQASEPLPLKPESSASGVAEPESEREYVSAEPVPAAPPPEPASLVDPGVELRAALDTLARELDRSLDGHLDPGSILQAALLVLEHDVGTPRAELELNGALAIPLEGLPEGVSAWLEVARDPLQEKIPALTIRLERGQEFAHGGFEREGAELGLLVALGSSDEPKSLSLMTSLDLTEAADRRAHQAGTFDYTLGATLNTSLTGAGSWKLETIAIVGTPVSELGDGVMQRIVHRDPPQVLTGGPWPRTDDIRRLGQRLQELHDLARSRASR
jgi:RNA polymerase sigma-70 factor (ECF subfamily)